jgi:uncharacterized Zn finger protein (UPF0148 family)
MSREKKDADSSMAMSELLLKGWSMLAESCPDCYVPIMRSRDKSEQKCVGCGKSNLDP